MFWSCFFNSSDGEKKNGSFRLSQRWITFRIWNGSKVDGKRVRNGCKINNGVMSGFFFCLQSFANGNKMVLYLMHVWLELSSRKVEVLDIYDKS